MSGRWGVAVIDGQPEAVIDAAAVALLVRESPFGVEAALERLRASLPAEMFLLVRNHLAADIKEQE